MPPALEVPRGVPGATSPRPLAIGSSLWAIAADVPLSRYSAPELDERLRDIGQHYDKLTFKYTGPWPPYNFVNIRLKLERAQ